MPAGGMNFGEPRLYYINTKELGKEYPDRLAPCEELTATIKDLVHAKREFSVKFQRSMSYQMYVEISIKPQLECCCKCCCKGCK